MISEAYNIDNMIYMASLPDKYFDLAIADPPYGINAGNGTGRSIRVLIENGKIKGGDWDSRPNKFYFKELFRVSINQIICGGNYFIDNLYPTKGFIIWDKAESMYNRDFAECEFLWSSFDSPAKIFKKTPNNIQRIHATQKPIALYKWLLKNYAKPNDKIFDPNMGSQSSRIAAYDMGFDYVGCELDPDYFKDGCKRFENHKLQIKIELPERPEPTQSKIDLK